MRTLALCLAGVALLSTAAAAERRVFETLSGDGMEAGLDVLLELVLVERPRAELDRELADQLGIVRRLASVSPRALLPIAVTLDRAYEQLRATEHPTEAFQIRALLAQLIEIHDAAADDFAEQAVGADLYVALAATFLEQQNDLLGIKYLRRALELDPANAEALLELSKAQELRGRHEEALLLLEDLRAMDLAGPEARLRLALNSSRVGRTDEAAAELRRLTESGSPRWIHRIAYQELARLELEGQRFGPASETIDRALAEFPRDCTLLIAALHVAERGGQATHVTTESLSACGDEAPSVRMRYASRSPTDTQSVRARLAQLAEQRLTELGAALAGLSGEAQP